MKGKIIKVEGNKLTIRPNENFMDIMVYVDKSTKPEEWKEVEIKFNKSVTVVVNRIGYYGELID